MTVLYACVKCGKPSEGRYCEVHGKDGRRLSPWQRGYQTTFNRNRDELLRQEPTCAQCGAPATVAHHDPPRRVLVASGVKDPDHPSFMVSMCDECHRTETGRGR